MTPAGVQMTFCNLIYSRKTIRYTRLLWTLNIGMTSNNSPEVHNKQNAHTTFFSINFLTQESLTSAEQPQTQSSTSNSTTRPIQNH